MDPPTAKNAGTSVNQIERFYAKRLPISMELMENLQSFGGLGRRSGCPGSTSERICDAPAKLKLFMQLRHPTKNHPAETNCWNA